MILESGTPQADDVTIRDDRRRGTEIRVTIMEKRYREVKGTVGGKMGRKRGITDLMGSDSERELFGVYAQLGGLAG